MNNFFVDSIKKGNIEDIRKVAKSDLHNHAILGGNLNYIEKWAGVKVTHLNRKLSNIGEMEEWVQKNYLPLVKGNIGFEKSLEAAFVQAQQDGVKILEMSIDVYFRYNYEGAVGKLISRLKDLNSTFAPNVEFRPELGFNRSVSPDLLMEWFEPFLDFDYFRSIDLYGDELAQPIEKFKEIYNIAKSKGFKLKAHVGEFGDAYSIREAVEVLQLDEVQHGISAVNSIEVMKYLANNKIQLNICPSSNVLLSRVESYDVHPIRILYDNGVPVTINTDDVIVFGNGVSEEYLNMYKSGLFSAKELNEIRLLGLES